MVRGWKPWKWSGIIGRTARVEFCQEVIFVKEVTEEYEFLEPLYKWTSEKYIDTIVMGVRDGTYPIVLDPEDEETEEEDEVTVQTHGASRPRKPVSKMQEVMVIM